MSGTVDAAREWGLPDWRDAATYRLPAWRAVKSRPFDHIPITSFHRARWEFHRRRDDLRRAFDERAKETYEFWCEVRRLEGRDETSILLPHQPGFRARSFSEDGFGYAGIPNPRISEQPDYVIQPLLDLYHSAKFHYGDFGSEVKKIGLSSNEVAVVFDLNKPLADQIISAKRMTEIIQIEKLGEKLQKRRHPEKWLTYLRVLDANECGATLAEIAEILPTGSATPQAARDMLRNARALCFNF